MQRNAIRTAVRAALALSAAGAVMAPTALAQDTDDTRDLQRVTVTGSRIKQIDVESAKPVVTITRDQIERSGQPTVADVLRNTTLNTFGSFREVSGSSFAGQSLVDLRGLGSTRTLVLLDGRRLPRSPVTGNQSIDLSTIPLEAVERIEILQDSASAVYGSDAIGGVVNVILRDNYDGAQVMGTITRPSQDGGDEESGSILIGGANAKGSFIFSAEVYNKDIIFSRDRPFTAVDRGNGVDFATTEGISIAGNTALDLTTFDLIPLANCDSVTDPATGQPLYAGVFNDPSFTPTSQACTYGYADISAETQRLKRQSAFLTADYELAPGLEISYTGAFSRSEAFGRYAPAVAINEFALGPGLGAPLPASAPAELQPLDSFLLLHRFAALGPRDDTNTNYLFYNNVVLNGFGDRFDWELSVHHSQYDGKEVGNNYVNRAQAISLTSQGLYEPWDPLGAQSQSVLPLLRTTVSRDIEADFIGVSGVVTFDAFDLPNGPVGFAVGFDYFDEHFFDIYDAAREAGNVIGSAGNSAQGARVNYAPFVEASIPVLENLDVNVAGRYDYYNDVGNEFSPSISAKYRATDSILVRGSWSEGFRAPNMTNLYSAVAFSADPIVDIARCEELGLDPCADTQANVFSGGNAGLKPETSTSYGFGGVVEFDSFRATVDWFRVEIEDGLSIFTAQGLVNLQADGLPLPPGTSITRGQVAGGGLGPILRIDTGWANVAATNTTGIDASFAYQFEAGALGNFEFDVRSTYILEFEQQSNPLSQKVDVVGTNGQPEYRANVTLGWNKGPHTVTFISRHIDGYESADGTRVPSWTTNDLQYIYDLPWQGDISFGVQNIGDNDPPLDPANDTNQPFDSDLYDFDGRVPYLTYRHRF